MPENSNKFLWGCSASFLKSKLTIRLSNEVIVVLLLNPIQNLKSLVSELIPFTAEAPKTKKPHLRGFCGVGRDRTADTRIFSPLLYRLSYRTIERAAKIELFI